MFFLKKPSLVIVAFYLLESLGVCACVSMFVCVCVFLHDNSKRNWSRNTKLEYFVVYENSSDEFDIELRRIKVKVTVGVFPFTTIQTVRSYSSTLVQARNLTLSMYLYLILIYKIYECRHAWMILRFPREHWRLIVWTLYLSSGSCSETKIQQYRTSDISKQIILILSRLSESAPGRRASYFQAQALYLSLRTS